MEHIVGAQYREARGLSRPLALHRLAQLQETLCELVAVGSAAQGARKPRHVLADAVDEQPEEGS